MDPPCPVGHPQHSKETWPEKPLPLLVHSGLTWPRPDETFEWTADAAETGKQLTHRLADRVGYLPDDLEIVCESGPLLPDSTLQAQGLIAKQSVRVVRRSRTGSAVCGVGDENAPCAMGASSDILAPFRDDSFSLECARDAPNQPILLRLLQLRHSMLPNLHSRTRLMACAPAVEVGVILEQLGAVPTGQLGQLRDVAAREVASAAAAAAAQAASASTTLLFGDAVSSLKRKVSDLVELEDDEMFWDDEVDAALPPRASKAKHPKVGKSAATSGVPGGVPGGVSRQASAGGGSVKSEASSDTETSSEESEVLTSTASVAAAISEEEDEMERDDTNRYARQQLQRQPASAIRVVSSVVEAAAAAARAAADAQAEDARLIAAAKVSHPPSHHTRSLSHAPSTTRLCPRVHTLRLAARCPPYDRRRWRKRRRAAPRAGPRAYRHASVELHAAHARPSASVPWRPTPTPRQRCCACRCPSTRRWTTSSMLCCSVAARHHCSTAAW